MKTAISVKVDQDVKAKAQDVAQQLGIPLGTLINAYLLELSKTGTVNFSVADSPTVFRGENTIKEIYKSLTAAKETLMGFVFNDLSNVFDFIDIDKNGKLIKNDYIKTALRVGDKFVFPGDDEGIARTRDLLNRFPELRGKFQPRWIDASKLDISISFFAFDNKIIFYGGDGSSMFGYVINNYIAAQSCRSLALFLWENANPIA